MEDLCRLAILIVVVLILHSKELTKEQNASYRNDGDDEGHNGYLSVILPFTKVQNT